MASIHSAAVALLFFFSACSGRLVKIVHSGGDEHSVFVLKTTVQSDDNSALFSSDEPLVRVTVWSGSSSSSSSNGLESAFQALASAMSDPLLRWLPSSLDVQAQAVSQPQLEDADLNEMLKRVSCARMRQAMRDYYSYQKSIRMPVTSTALVEQQQDIDDASSTASQYELPLHISSAYLRGQDASLHQHSLLERPEQQGLEWYPEHERTHHDNDHDDDDDDDDHDNHDVNDDHHDDDDDDDDDDAHDGHRADDDGEEVAYAAANAFQASRPNQQRLKELSNMLYSLSSMMQQGASDDVQDDDLTRLMEPEHIRGMEPFSQAEPYSPLEDQGPSQPRGPQDTDDLAWLLPGARSASESEPSRMPSSAQGWGMEEEDEEEAFPAITWMTDSEVEYGQLPDDKWAGIISVDTEPYVQDDLDSPCGWFWFVLLTALCIATWVVVLRQFVLLRSMCQESPSDDEAAEDSLVTPLLQKPARVEVAAEQVDHAGVDTKQALLKAVY